MTIGIGTRSARGPWGAVAIAAAVLAVSPAAFAQSAHDYTVTMANMDYGKLPANLKVGDSITWVNRDTVMHSITARDHSFDIRLK